MVRRSILAAVLASALAVLSIGSVAAHECLISSRSAQGNEAAVKSAAWDKLFLADILDFALGLNEAQIAWAVANRGDLPEYWVVNVRKTIGEGSSNPNLADGKGLDHLQQLVGMDVFLLAEAAKTMVP